MVHVANVLREALAQRGQGVPGQLVGAHGTPMTPPATSAPQVISGLPPSQYSVWRSMGHSSMLATPMSAHCWRTRSLVAASSQLAGNADLLPGCSQAGERVCRPQHVFWCALAYLATDDAAGVDLNVLQRGENRPAEAELGVKE